MTTTRLIGFDSNKGLPSDYVLRVCQIDRQPERVWAGTRNGLAISEDEGNSWTRVQELMNRKILAIEGFEDGIVVGTNSGAFFGVENNWSELPGTQGVRINSVSTIQNRLLIAKNDGVLVYPLKDSFGANELPFDSPFLIPSDALMINGPGLVLDVRDFTTELELYVRSSGDGDRRFDAHALEQLGIVQ